MNVIFTRRSEIITYCQIQLTNLLQIILNLSQNYFQLYLILAKDLIVHISHEIKNFNPSKMS
jgi:phage FluMu gp28-like protein